MFNACVYVLMCVCVCEKIQNRKQKTYLFILLYSVNPWIVKRMKKKKISLKKITISLFMKGMNGSFSKTYLAK